MFLLNLFWPEKDRVSFDIPIDVKSQAEPICFSIIRKKLQKTVLENYEDIKIMCKKYTVDGVSSKLGVYSDHAEFLKPFFDKETKQFLSENMDLLEMIHITDRQTFLRTYFISRF